MTNSEVLNFYRPLVHFIAELCGPACEVLLHDVSSPNASVIEIANGDNSGRSIGSPLTDFARKIMESSEYLNQDYRCNYSGLGKGKNFVSSTYFIKNKGKLIGMLCVNRDISDTQELSRILDRLVHQHSMIPSENTEKETLDNQVTAIKENMVSNAISEFSIQPERMSREEKIQLVHHLRDQGLLDMKGAVAEISRQLHVSIPTVYRYMNSDT